MKRVERASPFNQAIHFVITPSGLFERPAFKDFIARPIKRVTPKDEEQIMNILKRLLKELTDIEGINAAVVVNRDGFMIDGMMSVGQIDMEYMAAIISAGIGSSEQMARRLELGSITLNMVECEGGVVMVILINDDAIMAVVADLNVPLGSVRYQIKKRIPDIRNAL
jgi:predicted regulator of Ras-like GTPase activity (Roadblock/LC7/MglB family)